MWTETLGTIALIWYLAVVLVITIGTTQLYRYFRRPVPEPTSPNLPLDAVPSVTIVRPVKGLEPCLYECLASTFKQTYPREKLFVHFCISSRDDPAYPTLERLVADYATFNAKIFIEERDNRLRDDTLAAPLGPNPKIRNLSAAYNSAPSDIVWIIDCNVWVSPSTCGIMVDSLCGLGPIGRGRKYKFVHQLPLAVDISSHFPGTTPPNASALSRLTSRFGGLLDELFLSTSHAKFYTAISTVAIAPCVVGKSNMFRRSHLSALTQPPPTSIASVSSTPKPPAQPGIDFFSHNICEDHLIGDLLWRSPVPAGILAAASKEGTSSQLTSIPSIPSSVSSPPNAITPHNPQNWGNHCILPTPPCIQPLAHIPLHSYASRRARWLRVRKFTVPLATLVEPGTESLLATALGAWGMTTAPWPRSVGVPGTWAAFGVFWVLGVLAWAGWDWGVWRVLQGWRGEGGGKGNGKGEGKGKGETPFFVGSGKRRGMREWVGAWMGREVLAWPVWVWAVVGGTEVVWRGRRFKVGLDMRVRAVGGEEGKSGKRL